MRTLIQRMACFLFFAVLYLSLQNEALAISSGGAMGLEKPLVVLDGNLSSRYGYGPATASALGLWPWASVRFGGEDENEAVPLQQTDGLFYFPVSVHWMTVHTKPAGLTIFPRKKLDGPDRVNFSFLEVGTAEALPYPSEDLAYRLSLFFGFSDSETDVNINDGGKIYSIATSTYQVLAGGFGASIGMPDLLSYHGEGWTVAVIPSLFFRRFWAARDGIWFQHTGINVAIGARW